MAAPTCLWEVVRPGTKAQTQTPAHRIFLAKRADRALQVLDASGGGASLPDRAQSHKCQNPAEQRHAYEHRLREADDLAGFLDHRAAEMIPTPAGRTVGPGLEDRPIVELAQETIPLAFIDVIDLRRV
jgi:hypothetical protein